MFCLYLFLCICEATYVCCTFIHGTYRKKNKDDAKNILKKCKHKSLTSPPIFMASVMSKECVGVLFGLLMH